MKRGKGIKRILVIVIVVMMLSADLAAALTIYIDFTPDGYLNQYSGPAKGTTYNYVTRPKRDDISMDSTVASDHYFKVVYDYNGDGVNDVNDRISYIGGTSATAEWRNNQSYRMFRLSKNKEGIPKIRYSKLLVYDKQYIDVVTTYTNWNADELENAYITGGFYEVRMKNVNWVRMKNEFFIAGTNTPVKIKGFLTYTDIDLNQGIVLADTQIKRIWANTAVENGGSGTRLQYANGSGIIKIRDFSNLSMAVDGEEGYDLNEAAKHIFSYEFTGTNHIQYYTDAREYKDKFCYIGFEGSKLVPSALPSEDEVSKSIIAEDGSEVIKKTQDKGDNDWTYNINALVPLETYSKHFYEGFKIVDLVDPCLKVKSVKIRRGPKMNVSDEFEITRSETDEGTQVEARARNCNREEFYGYTYYMDLDVEVNKTKDELIKHGHMNSGTGFFEIANKAQVVYSDEGKDNVRNTNKTVTTIVSLKPEPCEITVEKSISKEDCYFDHGNPTFIFNLAGEDYSGEPVSRNGVITFKEGRIPEADSDGNITILYTFENLMPGDYKIRELGVSRFTSSSQNIKIEAGEKARASFHNTKNDWSGYSDSKCLINSFD